MAATIPAKEFKAAVKALNVVLKKDGENPIKIVGVKKEAVVEDFTNTVLNYIDDDKTADLPDEAIDFYNNHIVGAEGEDEEVEEKPAKGKAGAKTGTKTGTKKDTAKKGTSGKPSNEQAAYDMVKAGKSEKEILAYFTSVYKEKGQTDKDFIKKRAGIYTRIAKVKLNKEGK